MFKRFLSLEWKQFSRSSYFQKGLAIKILLILAALYFIVCFGALGVFAFFLIEDAFPNEDPIVMVSNYLVFWFLIDLLFRFFMQQLPVMNIKPYMIIPIKRETVIHYLLGKTTLSFFNILPLFFFLPFSIVLLAQGYNPLQVICWFFSMVFFTISLNYLNFLLNKNNKVFYAIVAILGALILLEFYHIYPIAEYAGLFFNEIYNKWYAVSIPLLLMILLYRRNYKFIREGFYLDDAIRKESKEVSSTDLGFLNRFGSIAPFLKNDVKLIIRNARPKQVLMMSFLFLFYGLFFYTQDTYKDMPAFLAFVSVFITGGFYFPSGN